MPLIRHGAPLHPRAFRPLTSAKTGPKIDTELVRTLAQLLADSDLAELEIEKGDLRIKLVKQSSASVPAATGALAMATPVVVATHLPGQRAVAGTPDPETADEHPGTVKSPMVGTVYLRPSPEAKAFVEIGSSVKIGEKMLLVEAMKTFNEIVASRSGTISAIFVEDGQPIEYGQPLLVIE